jgi:hypothetical protein
MFPPLDMADWSVIALGALLGGLTRGFTGFGFAMIFMPLAASVVPPTLAIAVIWVIDAPFALVLGWRARREAEFGAIALLLVAASCFVPLGLFLLTAMPALTTRWVIAILILTAVAALASGWRYHGRPGVPLTLGIGSIAGLFSGLANLGGMPLALFWLSSSAKRPAAMRADIQLYFGLATFVSGAMLGWKGLLTAEAFALGLALMPIYGATLWLGTRGFHLASETTFRRIAYAIIFAAATISLPAWDGWLR